LGSVKGLDRTFVGGTRENDGIALDRHGDLGVHITGQLALGALDEEGGPLEACLHLIRKCNWIFADSRHGSPNLTEDFTADIGLAALLVGENSLGSGKNRVSQAIDDLGDITDTGVQTPSR